MFPNNREPGTVGGAVAAPIVETIVSPFHCLYQDALHFHKQSRLWKARSEAEAGRLARAALLLYVAGAEALVHQAAAELARPELAQWLADPTRPLPLAEAWTILPAIVPNAGGPAALGPFDPDAPPWPQFAELIALRDSWLYPGPAETRRAYYRASPARVDSFEPLEPRDLPVSEPIETDDLVYPKTGLPRDPYALRPVHLDTARGILDAAIVALDRRLSGALTRRQRHRNEPTRLLERPELVPASRL